MLKLIKADLYKSFHRPYLYVFMAVMAGIAIFCNSVFASMKYPIEASFSVALQMLVFPLFFVPMFVDIITAEEMKEHTLKNTVSFGFSRVKLCVAKNFAAIIVALVTAIVILGAFFGSAFLLLHPAKAGSSGLPAYFVSKIAIAFLLYIAGIFLATLLAVAVKRNNLFSFAYFGLLVFPIFFFKLLGLINPAFSQPQFAMLLMQVQILPDATLPQLQSIIWNALAHIAVFQVLGLLAFQRQEIN